MKNYIILIFFVILSALFVFYQTNNCYQLKIELKISSMTPFEIDKKIADELQEIFLQIEEIKDFVIFSRENSCTIYFKINPFTINKKQIYNKIQKELYLALIFFDDEIKVEINDDYDLKYQTFLTISSRRKNFLELKKNCDEIYSEILKLRVSSKILKLGEQKRTAYIYLSNDKLVEYDLDIENIKNLIKDNNITQNSSIKESGKNSYIININNDFKSIDDIKNIAIFYKDRNFSTVFENVFDVKEDIYTPSEGFIYLDDKKSEIFAISKKRFYPGFLFNLKLYFFKKTLEKNYKDIDISLFHTDSLQKIKIYLNNSSSIEESLEFYKKIQKKINDKKIENVIGFIGISPPKMTIFDDFCEREKNKITFLTNSINAKKIKKILVENKIGFLKNTKKKKFLKNNSLERLYEEIIEISKNKEIENIYPIKNAQIEWKIDNYSLNDYELTKKEALNAILASNEGIIADYFWDGKIKIPIVLKYKEKQDRIYIYSAKYKNLIYLGAVAKNEFYNNFCVITRKNGKYFAKLISKNPS